MSVPRYLNSFLLGAMLAGIVLVFWWREIPASPELEPVSRILPDRGSHPPIDIHELLDRLDKVDGGYEKLSLCHKIQTLSSRSSEKFLDESQLARGGALTLREVVLLAGWARQAPEEALTWAWRNYDKSSTGKWEQAFLVIGPEWLLNDSESFLDYYIEHYIYKNESNPFSVEAVPKLRSRNEVVRWVIQVGPEAVMRLFHSKPSYWMGSDESFVGTLETPEDFEFVLSTWMSPNPDAVARLDEKIATAKSALEGLPESDIRRAGLEQKLKWAVNGKERALVPIRNGLAQKVIAKWKSLDPEGYSESQFTSWERKR